MQETKFIEQNKQKWSEFEKILQSSKKDPDKLSELYIEVTDDLSYSRTFYPNRSVSVYLNNLAQKIYPEIVKNKKFNFKRIINFYRDDVPSMIWYTRKQFIISFSLFFISMLIGVVSAANDPTFPSVVLSQEYISMTENAIENGDPMAVYKQESEGDMFLGITFNNLKVSFLCFVMGILFSFGSGFIVLFNGILLGAFQYFFYQKGLFSEMFLTVWQHGTIEISCIIIAGAAGMTLGKGMLFPGTYSRSQSFQISARKGIIIMLGITPLIFLAGFIESVITRHTDVPDFIRIVSILLSLLFILFYFVWLPIQKYRSNKLVQFRLARLQPTDDAVPEVKSIKTNGELFIDGFKVFKKILGILFPVALLIAVIYIVSIRYLLPESFVYKFPLPENANLIIELAFYPLKYLKNYFLYDDHGWLLFFNVLFMGFLTFSLNFYLSNAIHQNSYTIKVRLKTFLNSLINSILSAFVIILLLQLMLFKSNILLWIVFLFTLPYFTLVFFICHKEHLNVFSGFPRYFKLIKGLTSKVMGLYGVIFLLGIGFFIVVCSPLVTFLFEYLLLNISIDPGMYQMAFVMFTSFFILIGFVLVYSFMNICCGMVYYSLIEINESNYLKENINNIGKKQRNAK